MSIAPITNALDEYFSTDSHFRRLYPLSIRLFDKDHWTPLDVVKRASAFLANKPGAKILDIGSGAGKFCIAGAYWTPSAYFFGIEQREFLVGHAGAVKTKLGSSNTDFRNGNFTQVNFKEFDSFYFYNSFAENLPWVSKIDNTIDYSEELYRYYNRLLNQKLKEMPIGTRLVTFKTLGLEIPNAYSLAGAELNYQLKFWIKKEA